MQLDTSTYGHVLVVMLSYMIIRHLDQKWSSLYLTVEEGLRSLSTLTLQEVTVKGRPLLSKFQSPVNRTKRCLRL